MPHYLLLNASPHKGNSYRLASSVMEELRRLSPGSGFEELQLSDYPLPFCTGCSACFRKGHDNCPHRAEMEEILKRLEACDGLVFVLSCFNMQPNAMAKNLIDHLCYLLHRPHFFTKKALVVTTSGAVGGSKAAKYVAGSLLGMGFNRCYRLAVPAVSWNAYEPKEPTLRKCRKLAETFHRDVASGMLHAPGLGVLIPYNLFRGMGPRYAKGSAFEAEDGVYWTEPERMNRGYATGVPLPFHKRAFAWMFYHMGRLGGKYMTITYQK